jgi:hypothetical protein
MFFFQPRREQHGLARNLVLHGRFGTPQHDRSDVRLTDKIIFVFRHGGDASLLKSGMKDERPRPDYVKSLLLGVAGRTVFRRPL